MSADTDSEGAETDAAASTPPTVRRRPRLRILLVPFGIALVFLGAVEVALRLSGWSPPAMLFVVDDEIGRRLIPNLRTVAWGAPVLVDERGLRVPETAPPPSEPAAAGPRFLFIGGSCTFGYGLTWDETYPQQFAELMRARGTPITVLNGGVPLGDSANRLAYLRTLGEQLRPDVIVFSEAVNDLAAMMNPSHQCFVDGQVMLHITRPEEELWPIPDHVLEPVVRSPLVLSDYAVNRYNWFGWRLFSNWIPTARSAAQSNPPFAWLYRHDPARWQQRLLFDPRLVPHGREQYDSNLRGIVAWARSRAIDVAFVVQPRRGQQDLFSLMPRHLRRGTAQATQLLRSGDAAGAAARLTDLADAHPSYVTTDYDAGIALLAAGEPDAAAVHSERAEQIRTLAHNSWMARVAYDLDVPIAHAELAFQPRGGDGLFLGDGMHPSARGNRVIAEELVATLERRGWQPRPRRQQP